jgi:hypothetical protein
LTALRWKLARLSAMTAGEIAHRARVALRDRVAPARLCVVGAGGGRRAAL